MPHAVDTRLLTTGSLIPTRTYCDQPYIVRTDDNAWLCCVTTGAGHEGEPGQHVTTMRSTDRGVTWSTPVPVEASIKPENSYAVMLKSPTSPRIFIFYNHNTYNVREVRRHDGKPAIKRVDSLGYYVFKYSDDHGRTWSRERVTIPVREFKCDRENVYGGAIRFFWNVGRPFIHNNAAHVPLIKVGGFGDGFFVSSEGVLLRSDDLLQADDPSRAAWVTLPNGDSGLRSPSGGGPISEEQSYQVLSDSSIHAVYRTTDGHPVESYSRDGGHTWSSPQYQRFADGRVMKHPRAANFAWRCGNGKYLYWFHNHGGRDYEDRNPVWLCGGVEVDSPAGKVIAWSQPEVALYDDDPMIRISYPDLIEEDGRYFVTQTQKAVARVHELPREMLEGMWRGLERQLAVSGAGSVKGSTNVSHASSPSVRPSPLRGEGVEMPREFAMFLTRDWSRADYGARDLRAGLTLELWIELATLEAGRLLFDTRVAGIGRAGVSLTTSDGGALSLSISDGRQTCMWESDRVLIAGKTHHVAAIVDGGPKIISFVIDGRLCDGGDARQFGWGRYSPTIMHARGLASPRVASEAGVLAWEFHARSLKTFEVIERFLGG